MKSLLRLILLQLEKSIKALELQQVEVEIQEETTEVLTMFYHFTIWMSHHNRDKKIQFWWADNTDMIDLCLGYTDWFQRIIKLGGKLRLLIASKYPSIEKKLLLDK